MVYPCFSKMALQGGGHLELKKMHKGDFWGFLGIRLGRCPGIIPEKISFLQFYSRFLCFFHLCSCTTGNNPTCMMAPPSELNGEPAGDLYGYPILPEAHELNPPGDWPSSARDVIPNNTTYSFMPGTHAAASSSRPKRQVHHP